MDFCKSRNSNSTSSQHSNSNSSFKSHASSNNGASYNLEYCTSSSSLSPFGTRANLSSFNSCPSSSAKTIVNVGLEEVFLSISNSNSSNSHISASSSCSSALALSKFSNNMCSSSRNSATTAAAAASSSSTARVTGGRAASTAGNKRKRFATTSSLDDREYEPSAKRQQFLPPIYSNDGGSVVSSAYPSPVDDILAQEIDTHSSSECLSPGADFELVNDDIPDSPNSLGNDIMEENLPRLYADNESHEEDGNALDDLVFDEEATDHVTGDNVDHSANSLTESPCSNTSSRQGYSSLTARTTSGIHYGERTPGQTQDCNNTSASQLTREKVRSFEEYLNAHYADCMTPAADPERVRQCPLPALSWANAFDVWQLMCKKDEKDCNLRNGEMMEHHPSLHPGMRAILLDWLIEVCEVYKLHRETYFLAVDYLDRYLSAQKCVQKTHLQLIGITCLFVAAKVEEIYPPKIGEFAYVTDGACQEHDILQYEILLLQTLDWKINPVTPIAWLSVYMQLSSNNRTPVSFQTSQNEYAKKKNAMSQPPALNIPDSSKQPTPPTSVNDAFVYPQFSSLEFVQTAQLLDLCSLDVGIAKFPYSVIAAAAISHTFDRETALRCSGCDWQMIESCARWMQPFFEVVSQESHSVYLIEQNEPISTTFGMAHFCPNIITDDSHIIQTHTTTMAMFDRARLLQEQQTTLAAKIKQESSPGVRAATQQHEGLLTPPASSRKPLDN